MEPRATKSADSRLAGESYFAWSDWERTHLEQGHSAHTIKTYSVALGGLAAFHETDDILSLTRRQVSDYLLSMTNLISRNSRLVILRAFYGYAVREHYINADPTDGIRAPKKVTKLVPVLTDAELQAMISLYAGKNDFVSIRNEAMLRLFCEPGTPRASEMSNIDLDHYDRAASRVAILNGKGGVDRVIPLSALTNRALGRYLRARAAREQKLGHPASPALFVTHRGKRMGRNGIYGMVRETGAALGIENAFPHRIRHSTFADYNQASGNVNYEMYLYGWRTSKMPELYGAADRARRAVDSAAELNRGARFT